jgi:hypothetical protein
MTRPAVLSLIMLAACQGGEVAPERRAELSVGRTADGQIALELAGAPAAVRAIEVDLAIEGDGSFELTDAEPERGLALDSVRVQMFAANRATLFAGSKRAVLIPRSGRVATFAVRAVGSGGAGAGARLAIVRAVVAGAEGERVEADLGPAIAVR